MRALVIILGLMFLGCSPIDAAEGQKDKAPCVVDTGRGIVCYCIIAGYGAGISCLNTK
jgi:hypothetical protein